MQTKLTLSIDPSVVVRAKRYAKRNSVSISHLVETYLDTVTRKTAEGKTATPVLDSLRGTLKDADVDSYRKYLVKKYLG